MKKYPIRSLIYTPLLRMGIQDEDWIIVLGSAITTFVVFTFLDFNTTIPLQFIGALLVLALTYAGARYLRTRKPKGWLGFKLQSLRGLTRKGVSPQTYQSEFIVE